MGSGSVLPRKRLIVLWTSATPEALRSAVDPYVAALEIPVRALPISDGLPDTAGVVLAMGGKTLAALQAAGVVPKNRTLTSQRGKVFVHGKTRFLLTYDPYMVNVDPKALEQIGWDLRLAARLVKRGDLRPVVGTYHYAEDLTPVIRAVKRRWAETGKPVPVEHDLETEGLHPYYADKRILTSQWCVDPGVAYVYRVPEDGQPSPRVLRQMRWLFSTSKVAEGGTNAKFDHGWMALKWGIEVTNHACDNLLVGSLLDENRSNSLNNLTKLVTDMGGYDDDFNAAFDKSDMAVPLREDPKAFLVYAGGDVDASRQVRRVLVSQLKQDPKLARFYTRIVRPASLAFEKIEQTGICVDEEAYRKLRGVLKRQIRLKTAEALQLLPPKLRAKHAHNLKLSRPAVLLDFFFAKPPLGLGLKPVAWSPKSARLLEDAKRSGTLALVDRSALKPSTAYKSLLHYADNAKARQFMEALKIIRQSKKTLETYVDGFLSHLRPDGRFHPTYVLYAGAAYDRKDDSEDDSGTNTGRLAARDPAVQTIPKRTLWTKPLRKCFVAPPGHAILQADYSQGELRVIADLSGDRTMLDAYARDIDLHARTAAEIARVPFDHFEALRKKDPDRYAQMRQGAKPANFGLVYRMSAQGLQAYAESQYGVHYTDAEAEAVHAAFFRLYPGVAHYHHRQVELARRQGFVRNPLGRVRHLPLIRSSDGFTRSREERRAINAPVQSVLSDLCIWSATVLTEQYWKLLRVFLMTHDSLAVYCRTGDVREAALTLKRVMETRPTEEFGWKPRVRFTVDLEAALGDRPSLADLAPMDSTLLA